ncbi:hypothetical protein [Spongiactinospora sp. TRM90649]|uniref:hypothetical protein n=1 Tax=Spongiactinospora sp. TRM90649 TaxID=3031114 RepID=UPI0023FA2113|nr:hypothetical protein [Spongiactinospora sp. TRM90649]MDF5754752.1 hypothetical protein [Spongiactinospora sp. TRM90649]
MNVFNSTIGNVSPGLLGFLVVAALGAALFMLVKSMNKQMSKIEVPYEDEIRESEAAAKGNGAANGEPKPNGAH